MEVPLINLSYEQVKLGFDRWAEVYDEQANPLTALEERILLGLLPPLQGRDVLDVGCGTGRWLNRVAISEPRSLTGVDPSAAMLERAARSCRSTQPRATYCFALLC
jgi:ubiquinone/menaquinone biosynthesis C-methylase UbiE